MTQSWRNTATTAASKLEVHGSLCERKRRRYGHWYPRNVLSADLLSSSLIRMKRALWFRAHPASGAHEVFGVPVTIRTRSGGGRVGCVRIAQSFSVDLNFLDRLFLSDTTAPHNRDFHGEDTVRRLGLTGPRFVWPSVPQEESDTREPKKPCTKVHVMLLLSPRIHPQRLLSPPEIWDSNRHLRQFVALYFERLLLPTVWALSNSRQATPRDFPPRTPPQTPRTPRAGHSTLSERFVRTSLGHA